MPRRLAAFVVALVLPTSALASCGGDGDGAIRLYTSVTEATVTAVVEQFEIASGLEVDVFRAPTGELAARVAAERREGGIRADVLWLTDPLTMQQYADDDILRAWDPVGAAAVASPHKTETFWGTRILSMVIVQNPDVTPVQSWNDLMSAEYAGRIAAPDPGFAGSAFAVLGYFAAEPAYGLDYFRSLRDNGLVVVNAPGEVVTGVAEGRFDAGITLDFSARNAVAKGSPISIVWPEPGAIALYSPIAMVDGAAATSARFIEYVLSVEAQQLIAGTGWQPIRSDVPWEVGGPQLSADWATLFERHRELLDEYEAIFDE